MAKQVIVVRKDLKMRKGKFAAQCCHASIMFVLKKSDSEIPNEIHTILNEPETEWKQGKFTKIVVGAEDEEHLRKIIQAGRDAGIAVYEVVDAGKTEFHGVPTLTCAAFGPDKEEVLDAITGDLSLM